MSGTIGNPTLLAALQYYLAQPQVGTQNQTSALPQTLPGMPMSSMIGANAVAPNNAAPAMLPLQPQTAPSGIGASYPLDPTYGMTPLASGTIAGMNRVQPGPVANHMAEADQALDLTPQEKFLYNTHLQNLNGTGKIVHPDGSISSLLQMSFGRDGKTYNIPTVWGGQQLAPGNAIKAAQQVGLDKFPSYPSEDEAEDRYQAMHGYLEKDTSDFINNAPSQSP